jgi:hypothetical protein
MRCQSLAILLLCFASARAACNLDPNFDYVGDDLANFKNISSAGTLQH